MNNFGSDLFKWSKKERITVISLIVALVVGLAVVAWNLLEAPEKNLSTLKKIKASTDIDPKRMDSDVSQHQFADDQALRASMNPNVHGLSYTGLQLTDKGLQNLSQMKQLRSLDITGNDITDKGLASLENIPLQVLSASSNRIGDAGVASISKIQTLNKLELADTQVDSGAGPYLKQLSNLCHLDLSETKVDDKIIKDLSDIKSLQILLLAETAVTGKGLGPLADLPNLKELHIDDIAIDDDGARKIAGLKSLNKLLISSGHLTNEGLKIISKMKHLENLDLTNTKVTDSGLQYLAQMPALNTVKLNECKDVTDKGVAKLQQKRPDLTIEKKKSWTKLTPEELIEGGLGFSGKKHGTNADNEAALKRAQEKARPQ